MPDHEPKPSELTSRKTLLCPCCGSRVALSADNAHLEIDETGALLPAAAGIMFIDPHAHMIARTTDDYVAMARAGVAAVIEPAFWIGQPGTSVGSYVDYLSAIIGFERFRAGQFGIRHYCCVGLNPKEANNQALAEAMMDILPRFAVKAGVVAIGEIGYDEQTSLEGQVSAATNRTCQGARPSDHDSHTASRQEARHDAHDGCTRRTSVRSASLCDRS
jgi:hypothetical protein